MTAPASYLVDTGWIIRHLRGNRAYKAKLDALRSQGLAVSMVTVAELEEGVARATKSDQAQQAVDDFLQEVEIMSVDRDTCRIFGTVSTSLRRRGIHPGDFDVVIASTAIQHNMTVLTTDADDFSRFEGLNIITTP